MRLQYWISLGLALVLGVGAIFLGREWLAARDASAGNATMVVAVRDLAFGDRLTMVDLKEVVVPAEARPPNAFSRIADMKLEQEGRSALQAIGKNEAILSTRVTGPEQRATLSAIVAPGQRALSIRVNDVVGVGGFVLPNDRVDVIVVRPGGRDAQGPLVSDILLQNVRVLGVDQFADAGEGKPRVVKAVTLEVPPEDAQKLSLASQSGTLTLSLRNAGTNDVAQARTITANDLAQGAAPAALAPVVANAASPRPTRTPPRRVVRVQREDTPNVTVVRGEARDRVSVRSE